MGNQRLLTFRKHPQQYARSGALPLGHLSTCNYKQYRDLSPPEIAVRRLEGCKTFFVAADKQYELERKNTTAEKVCWTVNLMRAVLFAKYIRKTACRRCRRRKTQIFFQVKQDLNTGHYPSRESVLYLICASQHPQLSSRQLCSLCSKLILDIYSFSMMEASFHSDHRHYTTCNLSCQYPF